MMLLLIAHKEELELHLFSVEEGWWVEGGRAKCNNDGVGAISNYLHEIDVITPRLVATLKASAVIN